MDEEIGKIIYEEKNETWRSILCVLTVVVARIKKNTKEKTELLQNCMRNRNLQLIEIEGPLYAGDIELMADEGKIQITNIFKEQIEKKWYL